MRSWLAASILALVSCGTTGLASAQEFDAEGEAAMLDRINALRVERELEPLGRLEALDAVARSHSAEMASGGQLGHVSQRTGTPEDRVRRAGVEASTIAENVAMHRDPASAQQALVESEAHRGNMLSPDVTHVGIGVVRTAQGVYVTQVFAEVAPPPPVAVTMPEEAPEETAEAGSIFQIIPPFVEQMLGAAPAAEEEAEPAASAPAGSAPTADAPSEASEPAPAGAPAQLPPATAATLRQLVGLAQSLLGSAAQP